MKIKTFLLFIITACASVFGTDMPGSWENALKPGGQAGPELTLASGNKSHYTILIPGKPTSQEEKAASDLAQWLKEMAAADFSIVREGDNSKTTGRVISIGMTELFKSADLAEAKLDLGDEGYAIAVKGETLYLWGGHLRGPIYAVYALLEEDLGCRWYDYKSSFIPKVPELKFRPVTRHFVPVLELRDPYYYDAFVEDWSLRNRTSSLKIPLPAAWGGSQEHTREGVSHTFHVILPKEEFWEKHPEYFGQLNGARQPSQLCLTNPDVLRLVIDRAKESLKLNPSARVISISQDDGVPMCQCTTCSAIDNAEGSKAGALIQFVNKVAEALAVDHPDVKVSTLAYLDTIVLPKTIRPRDNVVILVCTDSHAWLYPFLHISKTEKFQQALKAWASIGAHIWVWDYTVNFSHYPIPMPNMPVVTPNMRFFIENGAKGIMLQGGYHSFGSENAPMRSWVWAKQLWDPSRDTQSLMRDFIYGYYGEAADPIWEYNQMLWDLWVTNEKKPHAPDTPMTVNPLMVQSIGGIRFGPTTAAFLNRGFVKRAESLFKRAEELVSDPEMLHRVRMAKLSILYVKVSQGVGDVADNTYLPGRLVKTSSPASIAEYRKLIDEIESIVSYPPRIGAFSERDDPMKEIAKWREVLSRLEKGETP